MSSGERTSRNAATVNINLVRGMLKGVQQLEVCGSYRRNAETIGDVDMVVLPYDKELFLDSLDSLVSRDLVSMGKNAGDKESWGEKKRLIIFRGIKFDIAIANEHNFGYQHWLRTGPAEANATIMTRLKQHSSKVRMDDGYLWHVTYHSSYMTEKNRKLGYHKLGRLHVPDEKTFFTLLGMPFIEPLRRGDVVYNRYLAKFIPTPEPDVLKSHYLTEEEELLLANSGIKQNAMF